MSFPEVKPGDSVLYVPGLTHALDRDAKGDHVFDFEHVADNLVAGYKKGDTANMGNLGSLSHSDGARRDKTGHIYTAGGHVVRPARPKTAWKATVLTVKADGKLDLQIQHPHGHSLEYSSVLYSATADLHSWHLAPEGA